MQLFKIFHLPIHAWLICICGAGRKGFDTTIGKVVRTDYIAVAVARLPESILPISGSLVGDRGSRLIVGVWVTKS